MGWFKKNKEEKQEDSAKLPELPKLPGLSQEGISEEDYKLPSLPRYPANSLGDKFSQNTIKEAVSGEKEDFEEEMEDEANESEEMEEMPRLPKGPLTKEIRAPVRNPSLPSLKEMEKEFQPMETLRIPTASKPRTRELDRFSQVETNEEPVFIRIDKFEESLKIFDKIKKQITGVEKLLSDIKDTKEQEEKELENWESKLGEMKNQIEDVDKNIFSKLE